MNDASMSHPEYVRCGDCYREIQTRRLEDPDNCFESTEDSFIPSRSALFCVGCGRYACPHHAYLGQNKEKNVILCRCGGEFIPVKELDGSTVKTS